MKFQEVDITKSSGQKMRFSIQKLRKSLHRTGADEQTISDIVNKVQEELYEGISTQEIYNRAYALLKKEKSYLASKYKLKKAIYELGPTGFPFELFISKVLEYSGYTTEVGKIIQGKCVSHEVDVLAYKNNQAVMIECKFHGEQGLNSNVKVPLYIHSRFLDIEKQWNSSKRKIVLTQGWVVTNTRFTENAIQYGECAGLYLLSWDYPENDGLKDRIDRLGLYPITVSNLLTKREKDFLLSRKIVLYRELIKDAFFLDHLGISETRKNRILNEIKEVCNF
ncbi:restriction endonuclease [Tenacibaculum skagerrakense]|uniref:Restriction endonuclease n=1 Tax=Tenacibaculum skagerrakense TaxID=186571 RepID=A0A4R2NUW0_9FLAO|nr:ATP cone domain-containing protein [Tenacibaculum skagerrakense]TCP25165.1 restriction endonuclease [Tenacibaculum skagerrakense]